MELAERLPPASSPPIWYVVFGQDANPHWIDRFLRPGFKHVFAFGYLPGHKIWIIYDVKLSATILGVIEKEDAARLIGWIVTSGRALEWKPRATQNTVRWRAGFWCVPAIKHLLGLRCVALTPWQLYRWMLKNGAKEVWNGLSDPKNPQGRSRSDTEAGTG